MPAGLADYGIAFFALGALAWALVEAVRKRVTPPSLDLARVVQDNTQAVTRLTVLVESQGQVLQRLMEILDDLRFQRGGD